MAKRPLTFLSTLLPRRTPPSHIPHPLSHNYHSASPPPRTPSPLPETAILTAALAHVPSHGFTPSALALGAQDAGYVSAAANLFPSGAVALVRFHLARQREALREGARGAEGQEARGISVEAEVRGLVWRRLVGNELVVHRWQEALALLALPANVPIAVRELALLADEILYLAGDKSVDSSWYTKRAALSAVYASCELFMTQDASPGFVETKTFLARRLEGVERARGALGMLGSWVGMQGFGLLNTLRSKGVRI